MEPRIVLSAIYSVCVTGLVPGGNKFPPNMVLNRTLKVSNILSKIHQHPEVLLFPIPFS